MIFLDSEGIGIRRIIFFFKIIATSFEYENRRRETWTVHFCHFFLFFVSFHVIYHLKRSALIFQR